MSSLDERTALATLLANLAALPEHVAGAFYARHPEWTQRFGPAGHARCLEDTRHHLSFLVAAIQAGRTSLFEDYVRWVAELLVARNISVEHLREQLEILEATLQDTLVADHASRASAVLFAGRAAIAEPRHARPLGESTHDPLLAAYVTAALAGQRVAAHALVVGGLRSGRLFVEVYRDVLVAAQRRIGELWAAGTISVAQEHMASAVTGWVAARLYEYLPHDRPRLGRAMVTGLEGELHALPAQFAADLLEVDGWDVSFQGINTPANAIQAMVAQMRPDLVGISITMPPLLPEVVSLIRALRRDTPGLRILLGGRGVRGETGLAEELAVELAAPFA